MGEKRQTDRKREKQTYIHTDRNKNDRQSLIYKSSAPRTYIENYL